MSEGTGDLSVTRREFIWATLATAVVPPLLPGWGGGAHASMSQNGVGWSGWVLYDALSPEAGVFARAAHQGRARLRAVGTDVTPVMTDLAAAWSTQAVPVCGLTRDSSWMILEQLARAHGIEPSFLGVHEYLPEGAVRHHLTGAHAEELSTGLASAGARWAEELGAQAKLLFQGGLAHAGIPCATTVFGKAERPSASPGYFVSWALVPRGLAR